MAQKKVLKMLDNNEYVKMFATFKENSNQDEVVRDGIIAPIIKKYGGKAFDLMSIGAGVGWLEDDIIRHPELKVNIILAIEPNPEHVEKIREKSAKWKDTISYIETGYFNDDYNTIMRFDVILMVNSIYYIRDPIGVIIKAKSFLKPGGQIMIVMQGEQGNFELTSCLHKQVKFSQSMYTYNLENSALLVERLQKNNIKYQMQNFNGLLDVTDFIERKNTPSCNDTISFILHSKYEDLDNELQDYIYKIANERAIVTKDNRYLYSHVNSLIIIESV